MNELIQLINRFVNYDNFSIQDFKYIKEDLENNNLDTRDIDKFINEINEKYQGFILKLAKQFNSLSEEQVNAIDMLNKSKINWELKEDWDYDKKDYVYKIVIENKEEK
jgi:hypothetical protein